MSALSVCCLPFDPRDPCSRRIREPARRTDIDDRRRFLKLLGASLLLPSVGRTLTPNDVLAREFVSQGIDPAKLWDEDRLLVYAYQ
ncbi:MAG: hypothetical protein MI757_04360, partial [Pirellulales bacterium]|nr:hypothetical protein [Pirellulales bacterium]